MLSCVLLIDDTHHQVLEDIKNIGILTVFLYGGSVDIALFCLINIINKIARYYVESLNSTNLAFLTAYLHTHAMSCQ